MTQPVAISIIGGGLSGALTAARLLESPFPVAIRIWEPGKELGDGVAYATRDDDHILNVPAARMSLFPERPDDFLEWLAREGTPVAGTAFVPRSRFGAYCRAVLQAAVARPGHPGSSLTTVRDSVVDIVPESEGATIVAKSGTRVKTQAALIATGNHLPFVPVAIPESPRVLRSPWQPGVFSEIASDEELLLVGSGLTTVDVLMSLKRRGHRGRIHVISKHGELPLAHASPPFAPGAPDLAKELVPGDLRASMKRVRAALKRAEGIPWQYLLDTLRPVTNDFWKSLSDREAARFLRHLRHHWDQHRHRIATEVKQELARLAQTGFFSLRAGRITQVTSAGARVAATYRPRGETKARELAVDRLVFCSGSDVRFASVTKESALYSALAGRGLIAPGPAGIGIRTDHEGWIANSHGAPIFAIGPSRVGTLWETTANPEIRAQALAFRDMIAGRFNKG